MRWPSKTVKYKSWLACTAFQIASTPTLYVTHVMNFTRLPHFSACNIEKLREPGDEATIAVLLSPKYQVLNGTLPHVLCMVPNFLSFTCPYQL